MKQKSLDTIILEEAIRAKLTEQSGFTPPTIQQKPGSAPPSVKVNPFNAAKVADLIYNAKGYFVDDEEKAKNVIEQNIKNIQQYTDVTKALQKLSGGRGMGAYLRSFMDLSDRLEIAGHLMNVLPKSQWEWTIKAIVPWDEFKRVSAGGTKYQASGAGGEMPRTAAASNAATKLITTVYNTEWQKRGEELWGEFKHDVNTIGAVATAFIPVVGPVLSSLISLADAKQYYDEGDKYTAGLITVLSLIPGGKLLAKSLARKIITKSGALTAAEKTILSRVAANKSLVNAQLGSLLQQGVSTGKITDAMLKSIPKIVKPVSKGVYQVVGTSAKIVTPVIAYDAAWNAANPNVTETEMLAILTAEEEILAREVNSMFKRRIGIREHVYIGGKAPMIEQTAFTPPEDNDASDSESENTGSIIPYVIIGGIVLAGVGGLKAKGSFKGLSKLFNALRLPKRMKDRWILYWSTSSFNAKLSDLGVKGLTRDVYKNMIVEVRRNIRQDLESVLGRFERGYYNTIDEAVNDFINNAPFRLRSNNRFVNKETLTDLFEQIQQNDPALTSQMTKQAAQAKLLRGADEFYKTLSSDFPIPTKTRSAGFDTATKRAADEIDYKNKLAAVQRSRVNAAEKSGYLTRQLSQEERDVITNSIKNSSAWKQKMDSNTKPTRNDLFREIERRRTEFLIWRASNPELPITSFKVP